MTDKPPTPTPPKTERESEKTKKCDNAQCPRIISKDKFRCNACQSAFLHGVKLGEKRVKREIKSFFSDLLP